MKRQRLASMTGTSHLLLRRGKARVGPETALPPPKRTCDLVPAIAVFEGQGSHAMEGSPDDTGRQCAARFGLPQRKSRNKAIVQAACDAHAFAQPLALAPPAVDCFRVRGNPQITRPRFRAR